MAKRKHDETPQQTSAGLYPIRTVSNLTGVNSITLRAWERRYGLIVPTRTPKGHRLYSQAQVDQIHRVVQMLERGIPISQVGAMLREEATQTRSHGEVAGDIWTQYQQRMINAIVRFDQTALENTYNDALALYPIDVATTRLIVPLLQTLGKRWETSEGSVAEEHFFGSYLRNKLGARFHHKTMRATGPLLIMACLPGDYHEIGLLLFCLSALERDYRVVFLGANLPLEELPAVVIRTEASGIVLAGSVSPQPDVLSENLPRLVERLDIPIFIGGKAAARHFDAISAAGAIPLGTDTTTGLKRIEETLIQQEKSM